MRFIVALIALLASDAVMAPQQTFRDANGRTLGSSSTDTRGNTTYSDSMGRKTWRAATDSGGNTTFYDEMAERRTVGTDTNGNTILYDNRSPDRDHPSGQVMVWRLLAVGNTGPRSRFTLIPAGPIEARWRGFRERARNHCLISKPRGGADSRRHEHARSRYLLDDGYPWSPAGTA